MHVGTSRQYNMTIPPIVSEHRHRHLKRIVIGVIIAVGIIALSVFAFMAYQKNRTIGASDANESSAAENSNSVSISGANGGAVQAGSSKSMPADFPLDHFTLYMGSIVNSSRVTSGANTAWTVVIETRDPAATVKQNVFDNLKKGDWTLVADTKYGGNTMIIANKADPVMRLVANVGEKDGKTRVGYTLTKGGQANLK